MLRNVSAVIVGAIAWMVVFYALAIGLASVWPEYGLHGRAFFEQGVFTFTPLMAAGNLLLWVLAEMAAGFVAMKVAQRSGVVSALATIVTAYLALMHIVLYWDRFPWWYNLGVVLPAVPAILLGGLIARRRAPRIA